MEAIADSDAAAAREAMRRHLSASQRRYHGLLRTGSDLQRLFSGNIG
jgi:DNA-binding FadR family transcriptional regulator